MRSDIAVLTEEEMRQMYGAFHRRSPQLGLRKEYIPEEFWPLIPYAAFWGIMDDCMREELVETAPAEVQRNLKDVVSLFDNALDGWLAGPEARDPQPSQEYLAFSAMRMAADFV